MANTHYYFANRIRHDSDPDQWDTVGDGFGPVERDISEIDKKAN